MKSARSRGRPTLVLLIGCATAAGALAEPAADEPAPVAEVAAPDEGRPERHARRHHPTLSERQTLLDEMGGLRPALAEHGVSLELTYTAELLGNLTGGLRRGTAAEGLLDADLDIDAGKALGLSGLAVHATAYQIHGEGLTASHVGNLDTLSDIEATRATRLSTLYAEQSFAGGKASLRAGQLAVDDEFFISAQAVPLVNATFGWPTLGGIDLPSGGPSYPLGTPGVRGRIALDEQVAWMAAVFNGDPVGRGEGDPQRRDPSGTAFRVGDDAFAITELGFERNPGGAGAGTYKLGAWYHSGRFDDQRRDTVGRSLADPAGTGAPAVRRTNFAVYAVADQTLWRSDGGQEGTVAGFLRAAGAPGDRNLVDLYADAGLTATGVVPGRRSDVMSFGIAYAHASLDARRLDRDARAFTGSDGPLRDFEAVLELTYQLHVAPWLIVQPDLQLVLHPGAHAARPDGAAPGDALVVGLRTALRF